MPLPKARRCWSKACQLGILVVLAVGLLILGGERTAQAKPDLTKKPSTFPKPVERKLEKQEVGPAEGKIELTVDLALPKGWKWNTQIPIVYYVDVKGDQGPVDRAQIRRQQKAPVGKGKFVIPISVGKEDSEPQRTDAVEVTLNYFICQEEGEGKEGICRAGSVIWKFPLRVKAGSKRHKVPLKAKIPVS